MLVRADLYALCSDAILIAVKRCIGRVQSDLDTLNAKNKKALNVKQYLESVPAQVVVTQQDLDAALENLTPSLSEQELRRLECRSHR
jgi:SpoVK/Ycf46/Vps4 family AAA+-type ATPase